MESFRTWRRQSILAAQEGHLRHCLLAIVVTLFSLVTIGASDSGAQEGTPAVALDIPGPAECTVEPRSEAELRALFREAAATPIPSSPEASPTPAIPPTGAAADKQTMAALNATWRQYMACISAGDQARMFAVVSDHMVRRQFVVDIAFGVNEDALFAYLSATPVPLVPDQAVPFVPFAEGRVLSDGRVAVMGPGELGRGDVRIFVKAGGRWLIDDWFDLQ